MKIKNLAIIFLAFLPVVVFSQTQKAACVAFYNVENLFDTIDGPNDDAEFLPNGSFAWGSIKYKNKLENLSKVISQIGDSPDGKIVFNGPTFLGVSEIENRTVLEDLVNMPLLKDQKYEIVHFDSPDKRGVDVGFLYKGDRFTLLSAKPHLLLDPEQPDRRTRDQLLVSGIFDGDTLHFIVNHWPSRFAVSEKRVQAAKLCRSIVDSILNVNVNAKIFVMGDFNDSPVDPSLNWLVHKSEKKKQKDESVIKLHNEGLVWHKKGIGTLAHGDLWQVFDMIIVSPGVMNDTVGFKYFASYIFDRSWLHQQEDGKYKGYPLRTHAGGNYLNGYSDHLPVYMYITKTVNE